MHRAVFGGSFDPVHNGHINLVKQVYSRVGLDEIIIMPTGISPFKQNMERIPASGKQRFDMCKLAFEDVPYVTVSDYEISQPDVSYTAQHRQELLRRVPVDQADLLRVADAGTADFGVFDDIQRHVKVRILVHVDVADPGAGLDTGHQGVFHTGADNSHSPRLYGSFRSRSQVSSNEKSLILSPK